MSSRDKILAKIIERASNLFKVPADSLSAKARFVKDLKAKSVNYVQIISVLEEEFDATIPFMDFRRRKTIGEAADFVSGLIEG